MFLILEILSTFRKLNNPQAPIVNKSADELIFRRFQGKGVDIFKIQPSFFSGFLYQDNDLSQRSSALLGATGA